MESLYKQKYEKLTAKVNMYLLNGIINRDLMLECFHWSALYLNEIFNSFTEEQISFINDSCYKWKTQFQHKYRDVIKAIPELPCMKIPYLCSIIWRICQLANESWIEEMSEFVFMLDNAISDYAKHNSSIDIETQKSFRPDKIDEDTEIGKQIIIEK